METRSRHIRVHRFEFDVEWAPGHVACYLIDGPEPILIDAAAPGQTGAFRTALSEFGYSPGDIDHVLITHPHVDHLGEVRTIIEAGDPIVYAPAGCRARLRQDPEQLSNRVRRNCEDAGFSKKQTRRACEKARLSLERNAELLPVDEVDVWIDSTRSVTAGERTVDPISLPGHQADHLSYRLELDGDSLLFAGDMGIQPFRPILIQDGLDDGYRNAFDAFYRSLDRMETIDVDRVYPGHGPIHDDLDSVIERDRKSLDTRLDSVVELVSDGYTTAPEIATVLAGDHDLDYIVPETMSALAHLDANGRLKSKQTNGIRHYNHD